MCDFGPTSISSFGGRVLSMEKEPDMERVAIEYY